MRDYNEMMGEAGELDSAGFNIRESEEKGIKVKFAEKDGGNCYTLDFDEPLRFNDELASAACGKLSEILKKLLSAKGYKTGDAVLVTGLGNEEITADALGSLTLKGLRVTSHLKEKGGIFKKMPVVSALKSSVSGVTGMESFDIIKGVIDVTQPKFLICVDTLACKSPKRLSKAIQVTDLGISPGSGVNNAKRMLNFESLGIPVIAIGVPLVIYALNIVREYAGGVKIENADETLSSLIVTAKEIDFVAEDFAAVIAEALNSAL